MFTDIAITHYLLTFGSSCAILVLAFLLLGIRIPKQEELRKLRTARVYLSGAYFILAASGFFSYFMHVEAEKDAVLMASTLFIASCQAFLFTTTCITFIRPAYIGRRFIVTQLLVIAGYRHPAGFVFHLCRRFRFPLSALRLHRALCASAAPVRLPIPA